MHIKLCHKFSNEKPRTNLTIRYIPQTNNSFFITLYSLEQTFANASLWQCLPYAISGEAVFYISINPMNVSLLFNNPA